MLFVFRRLLGLACVAAVASACQGVELAAEDAFVGKGGVQIADAPDSSVPGDLGPGADTPRSRLGDAGADAAETAIETASGVDGDGDGQPDDGAAVLSDTLDTKVETSPTDPGSAPDSVPDPGAAEVDPAADAAVDATLPPVDVVQETSQPDVAVPEAGQVDQAVADSLCGDCDDGNPCTKDKCGSDGNCQNDVDDSYKTNEACDVKDPCAASVVGCKGGALACVVAGPKPGSEGQPCQDGAGKCAGGACVVNVAPVITSGDAAPKPALGGSKVKLTTATSGALDSGDADMGYHRAP
ncbi:MAG: hypothetical protein FJ100_10315 [Deltaproteobacteria bacterium]|nr:hypothetical protein [Deltaproteobacteria bacterium]